MNVQEQLELKIRELKRENIMLSETIKGRDAFITMLRDSLKEALEIIKEK